jgi:ATP synthase protein I
MTADKPPPSLEDLDERLRKARSAQEQPDSPSRSGPIGQALRLATEMAAALVVGAVIGWFLDEWLGTRPWLLLLFLALGMAAGTMNAYRVALRLQDVTDDNDENSAG